MELNPIIVTENSTGEVFRAYFKNGRSSKDFAESLSSLNIAVMYSGYGSVMVGKFIDGRDGNKNKFVSLDEVILYPTYGNPEIKTTHLTDFKCKYSPVLTIEMASVLNKLTSDFIEGKK